jgi:hypothetical protein
MALFELGDGVAHAVMTLARTRTGFFEDGSFRARARTAAAATRLSSTALPDRLVRSWMTPQRARPCFRMSTDLAIRRRRVSSVLAPSTCSTCHDLLL